ncbi:MAG: cytochrome c nitrite reductase small subunit [Salinivirgaceae bacterium]|nr:cytochrome c nitrite reductase small subunit [Salinivirgaceae bacterium]
MASVKFFRYLIPPDPWKFPVILVLGIFVGLALYLFKISKAVSYLSDEPTTCVNCHIMAPQYATWQHSSHRQWTNCNDCHVPHNNVFNKYYFKAKDGIRHATIFTLRSEPQVIMIHEEGQEVVHQNCIRCHEKLLDVDQKLANNHFKHERTGRKCWECHREVPHGRVNSLSSTPYARVPLPESPVPDWLKMLMDDKP